MYISKRLKNKDDKRERLLKASHELFLSKGVVETTISAITKIAGVAKGTFYLYYPDKYAVLNELILYKSTELLKNAVRESVKLPSGNISERVIFIVDYVIDYFIKNEQTLQLIDKNLSWGMFVESIESNEDYHEIRELREIIFHDFEEAGYTRRRAELLIFMIIEMVGSVCYSSIILKEPATIDEVKTELLEAIRKMLD